MAVSQIGGTNNGTTASGTSVVITKPTSVAEGDVLTALLSTTNQTFTAPSGWTRVATGGNASNWSVDLWYKVAGASEPASYTFSVPVAGIIVGAMNAWRGVNNADPIGAFHAETVTNSNLGEPHTGPSVDATGEASGRVFYVRAVKAATAATYTINTSGVSQRSGLNATSGGVTFTNGWFSNDSTYSTDGVKTGASLSINVTETNNFEATYVLRSLPEGSFSGNLGSVTGSFTGGIPSQGGIAASLGNVTGTFAASGTGGPFTGALGNVTGTFSGQIVSGAFSASLGNATGAFSGQVISGALAATLPGVTANLAGGVDSFGELSATLALPVLTLQVETRPFGGRVILVRPHKRGQRVVGDTLVPILVSQVNYPDITGSLSGVLPSVSSIAFYAFEEHGSFSATLPAVQGSFTGLHTHGGLSATLPAVQGSFTGYHVIGSLSATLPSAQADFAGYGQAPTGTFSATLSPVQASISAKKVNIVYAVNIGDGSTTSFTITHNLGSKDVLAAVYETASPYEEVQPTAIERTTTNTITVRFPSAPTTNQYRVVVVYG